MTKKTVILRMALAVLALFCSNLDAWEKKQAPIMTKWADEVSPTNALPEYPRPQLVRKEWLNLNGLWEFEGVEGVTKRIPSSEWKGVDEKIFKDVRSGEKLSGEILVPYPVESALSGVMKHYEYMKYRREFEIPANWKGKGIKLNFGAVDAMCEVYINGKLAGSHKGGYDSFSFDITKLLKGGKNEIIVSVYDPTDNGNQPVGKQRIEPEGYWYTPCSGIWQTVWLEPVEKGNISSLKLIPHVGEGYLGVTAYAEEIFQCIELEAYDGGKKVAEAVGTANREIKLPIKNAKLWSPDSPFLYDLKIKVKKDGKLIDEVDSYFGMRELGMKEIDGVIRPTLNGKFIFQIGTLDQGYWPDGNLTAPTDEALKSDIQNHKDLGFNLIRKHIKVEPARWFYWCDKIGILVWQDMPNSHTHALIDKLNKKNISYRPKGEDKLEFERQLKAMVDQHISHPCIVTWILFNEGWGIYKREDVKVLSDWLSAYDPSRFVNDSSGLPNEHSSGDVYDIHIYTGPSASLSGDPATKTFAALGEYGGTGLNVKGHNWFNRDGWAYGKVSNNNEELTKRYLNMQGELFNLMFYPGLSASVYTQISDVEGETNGLYTYDRKVLKMDAKKIKAAHDKITETSKNMPKICDANSKLSFANKKNSISLNASDKIQFAFMEGEKDKDCNLTAAIATCELNMPIRKGAEAGVVMRADGDSGYFLGIRADSTMFISGYGKAEGINVERKVELKGKLKLKAQAFGSVLYLDVNGNKIFAREAYQAFGKFGVFVKNDKVQFANFKIKNPAKRIRAQKTRVKFIVLREEKDRIRCILDCNPKVMGDIFWEFESGLADSKGVSIRSMGYPDKYLTLKENGEVGLLTFEDSESFKKNATWYVRKGNADDADGTRNSFESAAKPGVFMRHKAWNLNSSEIKSSGDKNDSTFEIVN